MRISILFDRFCYLNSTEVSPEFVNSDIISERCLIIIRSKYLFPLPSAHLKHDQG